MTGLFAVHYFDPRNHGMNMECHTVTASNAEDAIRKTQSMKTAKQYRTEWIECLGWSDE